MLITVLLRLIADIFVTRPAGIEPGQWSPCAEKAVLALESRHFRMALPARPARKLVSPRREWAYVLVDGLGSEGEWTCTR